MIEKPQGIIEPPLDELLEHVDSKYQLVIFASRRARQINDYYADLHDGAIYENVGPLVDSQIDDKPLSIALREINAGKLEMKPIEPLPAGADLAGLELDLDAAFSLDEEPAEGDAPAAE